MMTKKQNKKDEGMNSEDFRDFFIENYAPEYVNIPAFLVEADKEHTRRLPPDTDKNQSWRSVLGRGLEKVLEHILARQLESLGLELIPIKEAIELVEIDFGQYGTHLPDVDLLVYQSVVCAAGAVPMQPHR